MARTIVNNPDVFLMDEPLSSLDAKLRVDMRTELKRLHDRLKATFVYVTHDQAEAMTMADRIVVMNGGKVEQVGSPLDIYDTPMSKFVAGFFGMPTMNFLEGVLTSSNGGPIFKSGSLEISLPEESTQNIKDNKVVLGIRSEHVSVSDGALRGQARIIEPLGDASLVYFEFGEEEELVAKVSPELRISPGDQLMFSLQASHCHLFDQSDGHRLN